ncbi:MAG TPA: hypothetical protein VKP30_26195 [Polyangiaceae bacterium]|nr:hypothetical protein [Polyangiaceae bacterium]
MPRPSRDVSLAVAGLETDRMTYEGRLNPEDQTTSDHFGQALACDARWLAVGAPNTTDGLGDVTLFRREETEWRRSSVIRPPPDSTGSFGISVALTGSDLFIADKQLVHVYHLDGDTWQSVGALQGTEALAHPMIVADGARLVAVDSELGDTALAFRRSDSASWQLEVTVPFGKQLRSARRTPIALEGQRLIIGAHLDEQLGYFELGRVLIYDFNTRTFAEVNPPTITSGSQFGYTVALHNERLWVADYRSETHLDAARVFAFDLIDGVWTHSGTIELANGDGREQFGAAMAVRGSRLAVGAPRVEAAGAVRLYDAVTANWPLLDTISFSSEDRIGSVLAFCGSTLIAGAPEHPEGIGAQILHPGAAYSIRIGFPDGTRCERDNECQSDHCVDEVCCAGKCDMLCYACSAKLKGGGADGRCEPVAAGVDVEEECSTDETSACGRTGGCNGAGACAVAPFGSVCGSASCASQSTAGSESSCDGQGTCLAPVITPCAAGYACRNDACLARCESVADCQTGYFCTRWECVPKLGNGDGCVDSVECTSGNCSNGVCCETACNDGCGDCSAGGICRPVPAGSIPVGINHTECSATVCDGTSTSCRGLCLTDEDCRGDSYCRADGTCAKQLVFGQSCNGNDCKAPGCAICGIRGSCIDGNCCTTDSTHECAALGQACISSLQCASGFCTDGVCCDSTCDGQCEACSEPNALGSCLPVAGTPRGPREACWAGGSDSPCGGRVCDGVARQSCASYVGPDVSCRKDTCQAGKHSLAARCDARGSCPAQVIVSCGAYACGPEGQCRTNCSVDSDCSPGNRCVEGSCSSGSTCRDEYVMLDAEGLRIDCKEYRCRDRKCAKPCSSTMDCQQDYACDPTSRECVKGGTRDSPEGCALVRPAHTCRHLALTVCLGFLIGRRLIGSRRNLTHELARSGGSTRRTACRSENER